MFPMEKNVFHFTVDLKIENCIRLKRSYLIVLVAGNKEFEVFYLYFKLI